MEHARIVTVTLNPALDLSTETDRVEPDHKLRCAAPLSQPGGGGVNVSRAIARLGGRSRTLVALGGHEGRVLRTLLRAEGLHPAVIRMDQPTRSSFAVTDRETGQQYRFVMPGPDWTEADRTRAEDRIRVQLQPGDLLIPSGSLPPGVPPAMLAGLAGALPEARVILDTSGPALMAAAKARGLHTLRMDDDEAGDLAGHPCQTPQDIAPLARKLRADGVADNVLIAAGAHGTVIATAEGCTLTTPPQVSVVSAIGAGDSFVAAYALAIARGADAVAACVQGTGAAAAAVETPGTDLCTGPAARARAAGVTVTAL